jgi:hypothetical protein
MTVAFVWGKCVDSFDVLDWHCLSTKVADVHLVSLLCLLEQAWSCIGVRAAVLFSLVDAVNTLVVGGVGEFMGIPLLIEILTAR